MSKNIDCKVSEISYKIHWECIHKILTFEEPEPKYEHILFKILNKLKSQGANQKLQQQIDTIVHTLMEYQMKNYDADEELDDLIHTLQYWDELQPKIRDMIKKSLQQKE